MNRWLQRIAQISFNDEQKINTGKKLIGTNKDKTAYEDKW